MVKIVVFDTETTGLPSSFGFPWKERKTEAHRIEKYRDEWKLERCPHILQFSYVVCDTDDLSAVKIFDHLIDIHPDTYISEVSINVHHITYEKIQQSEDRLPIADVITEFLEDVEKADVVVGHNVAFDMKMVIIELLRLGGEFIKRVPDILASDKFECTMDLTAPICNLTRQVNYISKVDGFPCSFTKMKNPKLTESYQHYFGYMPLAEALHDALMDVIICLRVYLCLNDYADICCENKLLRDYLQMMTPREYWPTIIKEPVIRRSLRIANQHKPREEWVY